MLTRRRTLGAAGLLLGGCATGAQQAWPVSDPGVGASPESAGAAPRVFVPRSPAAAAYESTDLVVSALPKDPLRRDLLQLVQSAAGTARVSPPTTNHRYQTAADELATGLSGSLPEEVRRFVLSHVGVVESELTVFSLRASPEPDAAALSVYREQLAQLLKGGFWNRVGAGVDRRATEVSVVLAFWHQAITLDPVPRRLRGSSALTGRLLLPHTDLSLVVTTPKGGHRDGRVAMRGDRFSTTVTCDAGAGIYQVELMGTGSEGPAVLGNFAVTYGFDPPGEVSVAPPATESFARVQDAEQSLVAAINRERSRAGARVLRFDERLASIARAHSEDMADHGFVAHISPRTGSVLDRSRKAGLSPQLLAENVGQGPTVGEVHRGLMASPGHRVNILNPQLTSVGVGISPRRMPGTQEAWALYVTEVFAAGV